MGDGKEVERHAPSMDGKTGGIRGRIRSVEDLAALQGGVVSRTQLYEQGVSRGEIRAQVRARRWQRIGSHCITVHTGPLTENARLWSAVLEGGPRAVLDGASALVAAGLEHYEPGRIRVSVPRGARIRHRGTTVDIRQTRRWSPDDLAPCELPRTTVTVAAIRAALWARTNRQATLVLAMTVQQGLATAQDLSVEMLRIRRDKRRALLHGVLLDLLGGIRSLGELDVLRGCRERGIPEPDMQVLRRTKTGTYYLDFRWKRWKLVLEVDGIQHSWVENVVSDALRQNTVALTGDTVLRLPVLGLRVCPDDFFTQIADALRSAGCPLPGDAAA
jgi:very-short-patch-repair endonuclease